MRIACKSYEREVAAQDLGDGWTQALTDSCWRSCDWMVVGARVMNGFGRRGEVEAGPSATSKGRVRHARS
ncbi:MAG: hypothetical protein M3362_14160 [Acidobacteriota bacterium]|nr:hypothetical protein [Acidobacteriota bacterium]